MQPQYEKVAKLFNGPDAAHPGIILMTRVDCAMKVLFNCKLKYRVLFLISYFFWASNKLLDVGFLPGRFQYRNITIMVPLPRCLLYFKYDTIL